MQFGVHSIYSATEGEGIHIGIPQIFVRFQGCNIGCLNCDSKETWDFSGQKLSLDEVLTQVEDEAGKYPFRLKRISITGGDPLHPKRAPAVELCSGVRERRGQLIDLC